MDSNAFISSPSQSMSSGEEDRGKGRTSRSLGSEWQMQESRAGLCYKKSIKG